MTNHENSNGSISTGQRWHWMCGGRASGAFWGILFIVVGLFWLGRNAGWVSQEIHIWPIVLVVIGIWMIAGILFKRK